MSIPLDRLYHYIENIAKEIRGDDVIIYRFYPHGSKKLEDLKILSDVDSLDWIGMMLSVSLICHDQEPLNFYLYNKEDFWHEFTKSGRNQLLTRGQLPELPGIIANMHLRSKILLPFNCYDKVLICHSEKNSTDLELYESNDFIGVYWWSHAVIAQDWFRYAQHDLKLTPNFNNINKDFLVYNRSWSGTREYRLLFAELVADSNLIDSCNIKFSPVEEGVHYSSHMFKNKNLSIQRRDLENIYPKNIANSSASADYESADYATSGVEIVLETLFDDQRNHLTEKTLRPIACGRPFMLVSTPGSLKYLQSYGFETFDGLIDESYDQIDDPAQRLVAVVQEMQRIKNLNYNEKIVFWKKLYEISAKNQQRFFSSEWQKSIIDEYSNNLKSAILELEKYSTGKYVTLLKELGKNNPESDFGKSVGVATPWRTLDQQEQIAKWLKQRNQ